MQLNWSRQHRFRAEYGYSNLMFLAAGEVIEAASGQKWSDFVRQRILKSLEMERTVTSVSGPGHSRELCDAPQNNARRLQTYCLDELG